MGLTDHENEGVWKWAHSGKVATYFSWYAGQPDNGYGKEHFVHFHYDQNWNDLPNDYPSIQPKPICQI